MKITYKIYQTRDFEKGGTFKTYFIEEVKTEKQALDFAKQKTKEKFCEISIHKVETFASGSQREITFWKGIRA